jgi:hypothetical protein
MTKKKKNTNKKNIKGIKHQSNDKKCNYGNYLREKKLIKLLHFTPHLPSPVLKSSLRVEQNDKG